MFVALDVKKEDGYMEVAKKAASVVGLVDPDEDLCLFRSRGAMIPMTIDWTVGEHKSISCPARSGIHQK